MAEIVLEGIRRTRTYRVWFRIKSRRAREGWVHRRVMVCADTLEEAREKAAAYAEQLGYKPAADTDRCIAYIVQVGRLKEDTII